MTYRITPRTEVGLPAAVTSSSGNLRPPLHNEPFITAHYTGNNVDYTDKVTAEVVRQIQRVFEDSKPFEYNYVIGQAEDDEIAEFAGKFQAAHSGGENSIAFGVLFLLGVGEEPTPLMIDKWRWLRDVLIFEGSLRADVDQRMHFQMPGAATACPGEIKRFWDQFLLPWTAPEPEPEPEESEEDDMYLWKPFPYQNIFLKGGGPASNVTLAEYTHLVNQGVPVVVETEEHAQSLRSALFQSGLTEADLVAV